MNLKVKIFLLVETLSKIIFCLENKKYFVLLGKTAKDIFYLVQTKPKIFFYLRKQQNIGITITDHLLLAETKSKTFLYLGKHKIQILF